MDQDQLPSFLGIVILPSLIKLILEYENISISVALEQLYNSKVYKLLEIEDTKLWHYSSLTLYKMWKEEITNGEIQFPEEAA